MGQVRELNHSRRPFDVRHCRAYTILALRASICTGFSAWKVTKKKHRQGTVCGPRATLTPGSFQQCSAVMRALLTH